MTAPGYPDEPTSLNPAPLGATPFSATPFNAPPPPIPHPWGPFTASDLIRRATQLYRDHPALFLGISLLAGAASFIIQAPNQIITFAFRAHPPAGVTEQLSRSLVAFALSIVILLASSFLYAITHGVIYAMVASLRRGTVPTLGGAIEAITPRILRLTGGYLLLVLRLVGWGMLVVVPIMIAFVVIITLVPGIANSGSSTPATATAVMIGIVAIVLAILLLPLFFWLYLRYSLFVPIILEENLGANASIRRSIELTRHAKGRLAALYGFVLVLCIPAFAVGGAGGYFGASRHTTTALIFQLLAVLAGTLYGAFLITPIYGIGIALCYFDLRARKDAAPAVPPPLPNPMAPAWQPQPPVLSSPVVPPTPAIPPGIDAPIDAPPQPPSPDPEPPLQPPPPPPDPEPRF